MSAGICVSAPGKVLILGGYLVLSEEYNGLVLSISSRFYSTVTKSSVKADGCLSIASQSRVADVIVECPQLSQRILATIVITQIGKEKNFDLKLAEGSDRNSYVTETLTTTLNCIAGLESFESLQNKLQNMDKNKERLQIILQADNDFYSQADTLVNAGAHVTRHSLSLLPKFLCSKQTAEVCKTGLGSSAALVTSLVGALVAYFIPSYCDFKSHEDNLHVIHNLAQICHCMVQRKVGSGFDVAAACYGSSRYSRFSPQLIDNFFVNGELAPGILAKCVLDQNIWKNRDRCEKIKLPRGFCLLMGDVVGGSSTVSMVSKVTNFLKSDAQESARILQQLRDCNKRVDEVWMTISQLLDEHPELDEIRCAMSYLPADLALLWHDKSERLGSLCSTMRSAFRQVRRSLRELGELAEVPIEPPEQTAILDATMEVPGVIFAGVPGAGGYDAVFVIALDASVLNRVEQLWLQWPIDHSQTIICPLLCKVSDSESALRIETDQ